MTRRAMVLGLGGAAFVCGFCFLNDWILRQTYLVGNNMPASIYGILILTVVLVNPLLRRRRLTAPELAVIMALTLAGAAVPGGGLVRTLVPTLVMPHHIRKTQPAWKEARIVEQVPPCMLVDPEGDEDRVVAGYVQGFSRGGQHVAVERVPWRAWVRPLLYWLPFTLTLWGALIGLSLVLHRQWSRHEHLPYPIARFTDALLPGPAGGCPEVLRQRAFWVGSGIVFAIHLNNFAAAWFPDVLIRVPTEFDFRALTQLFPLLARGGGGGLFRPHLYLIIVGLAYFIPGDIAFSFGVAPFLWYLLAGALAGYGVNIMAPLEGTSYLSLNPQSFALFGANLGVAATLLYTGRHYYAGVACRSVGLGGRSDVPPEAVWGCRWFVVLTALLVVQLWAAGIEPVLAALYVGIMIVGFTVLSRVIAETGQIYLKCYFWPCVVLWGLVGAKAIGTRQLLTMMLVTTVLFIDPREALMPFMTNSLKVLEGRRVRLGLPSCLCMGALVLGLAVALPVTLYLKYDLGSATGDSWSTITVPRGPFESAVLIRQKLASQGADPDAPPATGLARLVEVSPNPACVTMALAGFGLVLLCSAARLRLPRWPLHPLLFVVWASTPLRLMGPSYLLGWLLKALIGKYGGASLYNRLKPLMIGIIAGELLGALFPTLFGAAYYFLTGRQPMSFNVIPG
ncbi:MAG: hypothetical protein JXR77_08345 [Lentisphaeria bacterium]|nr:hypothetical protein [Lentisphaeria bacterium]